MAEEILTGLTGSPANDTTTTTPIAPIAPIAPVAPVATPATPATTAPTMGLPKVDMPKVEAPDPVVDPSAGQLGLPKPIAPVVQSTPAAPIVPPPSLVPPTPTPSVDVAQEAQIALDPKTPNPVVDETMGLATKDSAEQTKIIEKLGSDVIDPTGKTAEGIQDEIAQRQKEIFLRDTARQNQLNMEQYSQKLSQEGFGGSGARESLLLMLEAKNANNTSSGLEQLQLANLKRKSGEAAKQEAAMQNLFNLAMKSGETKAGLDFARQLAANDPENEYWKHIIENPEFMTKVNDANYQAKIVANKLRANDVIAGLDFESPDEIEAKYDDWKKDFYDSPEELTADRKAAWSSISQEDIERIYQEEFGVRSGPMTTLDKDEVYAKWRYDKKVQNQQNSLINDTLMKEIKASSGNASDELLESLQAGINYFISNPNFTPFKLEDMTFLEGDIQGTKGKFLFQNWNDEDYNETDNKWSERTQTDKDMDSMWTEYVNTLVEGDMPMSRKDFMNATKEAGYEIAGETVSTGDILSTKKVQDLTSEKDLIKQTLIEQGVTSRETLEALDRDGMNTLLESVTPDQIVSQIDDIKDSSGIMRDEPGDSTGKMLIDGDYRFNGVLGLQHMPKKYGGTEPMPEYIVRDGVMYKTGPVTKGKTFFYLDLSPMGGADALPFRLDIEYKDPKRIYYPDGSSAANLAALKRNANSWLG